MQVIKKLLFKQNKSSLNLFLILPILLVFLLGCLCSDNDSPTVSCITADGKNLALTSRKNKLRIFNLSDGKELSNNLPDAVSVFCTQDNDIVNVKVEETTVNGKDQYQKWASWKTTGKSKKLAQVEYLQGYIGLIQNNFIVSSSREFVQKSKSTGSGKSATTTYYNSFTKSQVFTLEDLNTGKLTNYPMSFDKLGIEPKFEETYFRFYSLHLSADGNLLFAVDTQFDSPRLYKLDMMSGKLSKISENKIKLSDIPPKIIEYTTDRDFDVEADKTGKYIAFSYLVDNGNKGLKKTVRVFNLDTNQEIITKTIDGVSFSGGGLQLVFEESSQKLAMLVYGFRFEPTRSVSDVTVFDLQTGGEIATIDGKAFFKDPETFGLINFLGDDLIVSYSSKSRLRGIKNYLCKLNIVNNKVVWETDLK